MADSSENLAPEGQRRHVYERLEKLEIRTTKLETICMNLEGALNNNTDSNDKVAVGLDKLSTQFEIDKATRASERKTLAFVGKAIAFAGTIIGGPQLLHWLLALMRSIQ